MQYYQTDRQRDILLTEKKVITDLFVIQIKEIYYVGPNRPTCIYKIVNLGKSYDNIHGTTYTTKIMLSGIAIIKTGYFDNINDYYQDNIGVWQQMYTGYGNILKGYGNSL